MAARGPHLRQNGKPMTKKRKATVRRDVLDLLAGDDRRSIGASDAVAALVLKEPGFFPRLIEGMWSPNKVLAMRAADAAEKVSLKRPEWLKPYARELLGLMAETEQAELRWHLAIMSPHLELPA